MRQQLFFPFTSLYSAPQCCVLGPLLFIMYTTPSVPRLAEGRMYVRPSTIHAGDANGIDLDVILYLIQIKSSSPC